VKFVIHFWNGLKPHSYSISWKPGFELPLALAGDINYAGATQALAQSFSFWEMELQIPKDIRVGQCVRK